MTRQIQLCFLLSILFVSCNYKKRQVSCYPNGRIKSIWLYKNDTLSGTKEGYWANGNLSYVENHRNGTLDGEYRVYYENGFIKRRGHFINGQLQGHRFKYSSKENGKVMTEEYIINVQGKPYYFYIKDFDEQGKLVSYNRYLDMELDKASASVSFKYVGDKILRFRRAA